MSIYDVKIENLEQLPSLEGAVVVSDCDQTLFEHGSLNMYPDVEEALSNVGRLMLVSANPDRALMHQRRSILNADSGVAANKPVWDKRNLFERVAEQLNGLTDNIVILGDRAVADVWMAKLIFAKHNFNTLGVRVARHNTPVAVKADYALRAGFLICSALIKFVGKDKHFRPSDKDGHSIAESFLSQ